MFPALKANIRRATKTCKLSCNTAAFWRGGGGGFTTKFYTWRLRPVIKPLNLLCAILKEKVSLLKNFINKRYNFYILSKSFSTAANGLSLKYE